MAEPSHHQITWTAAGLRRAARDNGVELPVDYSRRVAADGITRCDQLGVTKLGACVVIHTLPGSPSELRIVVGYADKWRAVVPGRQPPPHRRHTPKPTPLRLIFTPWADPVVEAFGHRPGSAYIEATRSKRRAPPQHHVGVAAPGPPDHRSEATLVIVTQPTTDMVAAALATAGYRLQSTSSVSAVRVRSRCDSDAWLVSNAANSQISD